MLERTDMTLKVNMVMETFRRMNGRYPSAAELLSALGKEYSDLLVQVRNSGKAA